MLPLPKIGSNLPALTGLLDARVDATDDQVDSKEDEASKHCDVRCGNGQTDSEEPKSRPQTSLDGRPHARRLLVRRVELLRRVKEGRVLVGEGGGEGGVKCGNEGEGEEDEDEDAFDHAELSHRDSDDEGDEGVAGDAKGGVEREKGGFVGEGEGDEGSAGEKDEKEGLDEAEAGGEVPRRQGATETRALGNRMEK